MKNDNQVEKVQSQEEVQAILNARAQKLATVADKLEGERGTPFIIFYLGAKVATKYAISYEHVQRVVALEKLTYCLGASHLIRGITYYNAEIWPVIDTERLLGLPTDNTLPHHILLLRDSQTRYALAVRAIEGHVWLETEQDLTQVLEGDATKAKGMEHVIMGVYQSDVAVIDERVLLTSMNKM